MKKFTIIYKKRPSRLNALIPAALILLLAFSGCEDNPAELEDYDPEPILTAFLFNGEPFGEIYLERVAPLYGYYQPEENGIADAQIIIFKSDPPRDTVEFAYSGNGGIYLPIITGTSLDTVQGITNYRIEALTPQGEFLWAETVVPDTFTLEISPYTLLNDTIPIPLNWSAPEINLDWTGADSAGGYIFNSTCLTPIDSLQWLDPDYDDDEIDEEPYRLLQDIYIESARSSVIPWFFYEFVGWHKIEFQAASTDYVEYLCSIIYAPPEGFNQQYNVHGGLGIFSGLSSHSFYLYMQRFEYP